MRVLVTGGAGFIGSHLVDKLVEKGFQVRVLDDLSTGSLDNLEHSLNRIEFIKADVRDVDSVRKALEGVDVVVHEAAVTSVPRSIEDPLTVSQVNVEGTLNLLRACVERKVRRFVYASSSSVYGDLPTLPKREDYELRPKSPYAVSKYAGEKYCLVFHEVYGLETVALRYFNVYGPRQRYGPYSGVITIFINRALRGEPPIIYGDGKQTRDFIYVEDVVEATIKALEKEDVAGEVINVAAGSPVTINRLAELILEIVGIDNLKPIYTVERKGDIKHSFADITKAKSLLGWSPKVNLVEGLRRTVDWFKVKLEQYPSGYLSHYRH